MQCLSIKKKNSTEQCTHKALKNIKFCGIHAKKKEKKIWYSVHNLDSCIISLQTRVRSWLVRKLINLAGPGVLKRSVCHNEEDLVTCETKDELSPLNYFAFEEYGKIYWFDIRTIYQWSSENLEPTNPFTKQPLTIETRKRIKRVISRRGCYGQGVYHEPNFLLKPGTDYIKIMWYQIIQTLNENLFAEIPESYFFILNEFDIIDLSQKVLELSSEWKGSKNLNLKSYYEYLCYSNNLLKKSFYRGLGEFLYTLISILRDHNIQYDFSFKLMSARSILI